MRYSPSPKRIASWISFLPRLGHHRRVISRYLQFLSAAPIAVAAFLVACSTPGNYRDDAANKELLQSLRECLVEVPNRGEKNKEFVSPCVERDVASLNGITRRHLIDALGPARFCTSQTETSFPEKDDCPVDQNPQWSFYRHADEIVTGGGPELVCVANKQRYCVTVEWRRSQ
jgi:hypothetical protein